MLKNLIADEYAGQDGCSQSLADYTLVGDSVEIRVITGAISEVGYGYLSARTYYLE